MGTLLQEKKVLSKEIDRIKIQIEAEDGGGENPAVDNPRYKSLYDQKEKMDTKIQGLQDKAKELLQKVNKYKEENKNNVVYTYIQFHSMNGKKKF